MKCFTAVEIHFFAQHYGMTHAEVLERLRRAGLDSLPGGGAEIFHPEVRSRISHDKATADEYLEVHRVAHRLGMRTNATMLYGHIETFEHRVDHLLRLRALQDETRRASRRSSRSRSIRTATACATCRRPPPSTRCARWPSRASCSTTSRT